MAFIKLLFSALRYSLPAFALFCHRSNAIQRIRIWVTFFLPLLSPPSSLSFFNDTNKLESVGISRNIDNTQKEVSKIGKCFGKAVEFRLKLTNVIVPGTVASTFTGQKEKREEKRESKG